MIVFFFYVESLFLLDIIILEMEQTAIYSTASMVKPTF